MAESFAQGLMPYNVVYLSEAGDQLEELFLDSPSARLKRMQSATSSGDLRALHQLGHRFLGNPGKPLETRPYAGISTVAEVPTRDTTR